MTEFEKEDAIVARMIAERDKLEPIFQPYIDWLSGKTKKLNIDKATASKMLRMASDKMEELYTKHPNAYDTIPSYNNDDPWNLYEGFGKDKYLYSYYAFIEGKWLNLIQ